jgi:hypothetical protein
MIAGLRTLIKPGLFPALKLTPASDGSILHRQEERLMSKEDTNKKTASGQPAFMVKSSTVELAVTEMGGQMAPVTFFRDTANPVQPYYISPWQGESDRQLEGQPSLLHSLRGDFLCAPFGGNAEEAEGELHSPHGESAGGTWSLKEKRESGGSAMLALEMNTSVRPGKIRAEWFLTGRDNCIYTRHTLSGMKGRMPLGHHATLGLQNGPLRIKSSPLRFGMTNPYTAPYTQGREYYSLPPAARFERLDSVPTIWKKPETTDCSIFPAREGFVDILQLVQQPGNDPGWMTALCRDGGYLWFSLKNLEQLPSTVMWMENRGRHSEPWSGRNCCIGLEDVCGFFADGLKASLSPNLLSREGVPTSIELNEDVPTVVSYIQGLIRIDEDFDEVDRLEFIDRGVRFVAKSGAENESRLRWDFLDGAVLD